ncbi:hypothetical protein CBA19CS22_39015 [Caballeronia novacaledonica]|uniref:Uncharacterized protein n=1 Tax=Caballeronia novacaledonica TaxID=1544861 RepID=A0ACB5R6L2_9BURK|nr:hypothetical protein [Caballeronia sp. LZ029]MDR5746991.1 hypothetical protein [Caballeronia sp. LZ029]GJH22667.1 hypothetical protein CBA19CS22_39015 [Caballeronia novacaledonica]
MTVLATCGGGLDESTAAKAKAQLGHGGEISAETLSSVRASLISDGTLKSEDRIKAFDIFTKCALEVDKRIRDGQTTASPVAGLIGRQWYLQEAQYESAIVDQKKHLPHTVELTSRILKSGTVRTQRSDISDALWIRFREDGRVETNFMMAPHVPGEDPDVLFGEGSAADWTSSNERNLITVRNGTRYPPTFVAEQAKFEVSVRGASLVLTRAEGAPHVLIKGTFIAE